MKKSTKKKIIKEVSEIHWKDAAGCRENGREWYGLESALELAEKKYEETTITGGIILTNNKNYIVIASTKSEDLYSDITMIPKKFLLKIR